MSLDPESCYRALSARDPRFDGLFFVAVSTTGIYCRPVCRARRPAADRCSFYRTAAEAELAGYRACFRCRPELAPGSSKTDALPALVARALTLIDGGFLDEHSIDELAERLGVGARHLRRALVATLGVTPIDLAQSRRLAFAKQLVIETDLPLTDVAFASGFSSIRRFNAAFAARHGRSPSALRRGRTRRAEPGIELRLDYRPPLELSPLLEFLRARAIPGVERVSDGVYTRSVRLGDASGVIRVRAHPTRPELRVKASLGLARRLAEVARRVRRSFDLDAQPSAIAEHLGQDARIGQLVKRRPGLRVPGAFDGFETAARAILGQRVSVSAATTLARRLCERFGERLAEPEADIQRLFPSAERLAHASLSDLGAIGLPRTRAAALSALALAAASGTIALEPGVEPEALCTALCALPGVGPWTAEYVAMRVLGFPDAFPAGDLVLARALGNPNARALAALSEPWRPWRAYAVMHLWTGTGALS